MRATFPSPLTFTTQPRSFGVQVELSMGPRKEQSRDQANIYEEVIGRSCFIISEGCGLFFYTNTLLGKETNYQRAGEKNPEIAPPRL